MRRLFAVLALFILCNLSAMGQDGPNNAPKPDKYRVQLKFFKGNPKGSIEKGDIVRDGGFATELEHDSSIHFANGDYKMLGGKEILFGRRVGCYIEKTQPNCIKFRLNTSVTMSPNEGDPEFEDETGDPLVFTIEHIEDIQLGGTVRIRLIPEDPIFEKWAEIKIEKSK